MLNTIKQAITEIKAGKPVIVVDDENRENEGDLIVAAAKATTKSINFMIKEARGLVCIAMPEERLIALGLPPMVQNNTDPYGTDFTVSVDARFNIETGVSAQDRLTTIKALLNKTTTPYDLIRPGHVFPLRANPGGVLQRAGHTEAAVDLAILAGLPAAGITCEIMNADGTMARMPQLKKYAKKHKLKIISIADLIAFRKANEQSIRQLASATIPTAFGNWQMVAFESIIDKDKHVALIKGDVYKQTNVLVRVHSECLTGDVFGSKRCDCGEQLTAAMKQINKVGLGVILYMKQEGRGIGIENKLHAYMLQDAGLDTAEANESLGFPVDLREYGTGAQILSALGLTTIHLLTNNPKKIIGLKGYNLKVTKQVALEVKPNKKNYKYLKTKKDKMGHTLHL